MRRRDILPAADIILPIATNVTCVACPYANTLKPMPFMLPFFLAAHPVYLPEGRRRGATTPVNLHHKACTNHFQVLLCTTKLAPSTSLYYFVLQSLHQVLPCTTLYYKACTEYFPVLLCTTKFVPSGKLQLSCDKNKVSYRTEAGLKLPD